MSSDEQLVVYLEARVREFEKRMEKAERTGTRSYQGLERGSSRATKRMETDMLRSTSRINQALAATSTKIGAFGRAFAGGFLAGGAAVALTGIVRGVRGATAAVAELGAEARRAGVSVEAFQELKFVAEQNRIGVDALTDGLKELNLRADEFIVTGKGPAAEAFARLGYGATDLTRKLEDPSDLMLEIIGRMEDLDAAAQIRIADEIFGGTGGEQFVQLMGQGEAALRKTIQTARETGAVLDAELIEKAEELDRRFQALTTRVSTFGKELAVGLADAAVKIATLRTDLDDLFANPEQARALLGEGIADTLDNDSDAVDAHRAKLESLRSEYFRLADEAAGLAGPLFQVAGNLAMLGETDAAGELNSIATEMTELATDLDAGKIGAETFEVAMGTLARTAQTALSEVSAIDGVQFGSVSSALDAFVGRLGAAITRARELRASLPGGDASGQAAPGVYGEVGTRGDPRQYGTGGSSSELAPSSSSRPRPAPFEIGVPDLPAASSGGGGGSGRAPVDVWREALEGTQQEIRELEAEATALVVLAETGRDVGDALEYARKKAELLKAAQEQGTKITPQLEAEIDKLAESYARAGDAAEQAADDLQRVEERAEAGATKVADIFGGILDGSMKAKDALASLLTEFARMQMLRGFQGLASGAGGGVFGAIGGMLGFASGGYTGNVPEDRIAGVVHGREGVLNAGAMRMPGAREMMESLNSGRMPSLPGGGSQAVDVRVAVDLKSDMLDAKIDQRAAPIAKREAGNTMRRDGPGVVMQTLRQSGNRGATQRIVR
ncbi:hypothetical protein [uncultured Jannaschia sp.]|uniref:hypothetical protein n=1 Tax=uncultured Jannaschia sp. TaxID=293347 RepID=UPI00262DE524|nr:hypothetical protein [uncultured Jannaschia sp.]